MDRLPPMRVRVRYSWMQGVSRRSPCPIVSASCSSKRTAISAADRAFASGSRSRWSSPPARGCGFSSGRVNPPPACCVRRPEVRTASGSWPPRPGLPGVAWPVPDWGLPSPPRARCWASRKLRCRYRRPLGSRGLQGSRSRRGVRSRRHVDLLVPTAALTARRRCTAVALNNVWPLVALNGCSVRRRRADLAGGIAFRCHRFRCGLRLGLAATPSFGWLTRHSIGDTGRQILTAWKERIGDGHLAGRYVMQLGSFPAARSFSGDLLRNVGLCCFTGGCSPLGQRCRATGHTLATPEMSVQIRYGEVGASGARGHSAIFTASAEQRHRTG